LDVVANRTELEQYQIPRSFDNDDKLAPDPYFLENPNCVFCLAQGQAAPQSDLELRTMKHDGRLITNDALNYQWLYYRSSLGIGDWHPTLPPTDVDFIGGSNGYSFYVTREVQKGPNAAPRRGRELFADFVLLTLPLANVPPRFPTPQATGPAAPTRRPLNNGSEGFRPQNFFLSPLPGIQPAQ
jgi:hypothetical protein